MAKKVKDIDITKTGPLGFRQLQGLNETQGKNLDPEFLKSLDAIDKQFPTISQGNPLYTARQEVMSPLAGSNVGWGESMFDEPNAGQEKFNRLADVRANNQPWFAQLGAGVAKGAVLAGTTFVDGIGGTIVGAINAIGEGKFSAFWDNPFSQAMKEVNDFSEEFMPNYLTEEEQRNNESGEWYKNVFTANWWGNSFIKNLGFSVGAFYSGSVVSKALQNAPRLLKTVTGSVISAINEGKIEALNNATDWYELEKQKLDDKYQQQLEGIRAQYSNTEMYPQLLAEARGTYEQSLAKLQEDRAKVGNVDLMLNIPILTASNWYMWGKLYGGGANTAIRSSNLALKDGKYLANVPKHKIITGPLSEGMEEINQKIAATIPGLKYGSEVENFYMSKWDPEAAEDVLGWTKATMKGVSETLSDPSSWEEFTIGALTGAMGMPQFRSPRSNEGGWRSPITIEGGIRGEIKDYREDVERTQSMVDRLNARIEDPNFRNYYQGLIRHTKFQNDMDKAAIDGKIYDYKNAEDSQLISDIIMFDNAGKLSDYRQFVEDAYDTSDENIQAIIQNTTDENGNGPFSENGNPLSKEEIIEKLTKAKDSMLNTLNDYKKVKRSVVEKSKGILNDDQVEELTWLSTKSEAFKNRFNEAATEVRQELGMIAAEIEYRHPDLKNLSTSLRELLGQNNEVLAAILGSPKEAGNVKMIETLSKLIREEHGLDGINLAEKLEDLPKLAKAKNAYNAQFTKYINDFLKLQEDMDNANEAIADREEQLTKAKRQQAVDEAVSFSQLQEMEQEAPLEDDILSNSKNSIAKDYKKAKKFKVEADAIINGSAEFNDEEKAALHNLVNQRFTEESSLSDLLNPQLLTETSDEVAAPLTQALAAIVEEAAYRVSTDKTPDIPDVKDNKDKPTVDDKKTGSDDTPTVPTNSTKVSPLKTILANSIDKETVENLIMPKIDEVESLTKKAIETKDDSDIEKANVSLNELIGLIEGLPEAGDTKFRESTDIALQELYKRIPNISPATQEGEELNSISRDSENEEIKRDEKGKYNFYRSDLTEHTIPSFNDGTLVPFITEHPEYKEVYNKIEFDYINKGNVKEGDTIHLKLEKVGGYNVVFMLHDGHIVGVLPTVNRKEYRGIKTVNERLAKGEDVTVTVSKIMLGKFKYDKSRTQSVKDVAGLEASVMLGVMKPVAMHPTLVTNSDIATEPVFDELHADGKVYLLLKNSRGTYSPKLLRVKHFNNEEFPLETLRDTNNTRAKKIHSILDRLSKVDNPDEVTDLFKELGRIVHLGSDFHMNLVTMGNNLVLSLRSDKVGRANIVVEKGGAGVMYVDPTQGITTNPVVRTEPSVIYNSLLNYLYKVNPPFAIKANEINKGNYNKELLDDDILYTHLTNAEMAGSWFTTSWYDDAGVEQKAVNPKGTFSIKPRQGTRLTVGGKQFYVDKGVIYDVNENEVTEDTQLIKDLAYVIENYGDRLNGVNMDNGKILLPSGRALNVVTQKYLDEAETKNLKDTLEGRPTMVQKAQATLKKLGEDQKKVKRLDNNRPDTSNGSYMILEEDGQYHKYQRVHAVIGSNWNTEFSDKGESPALKWGSLVDDLARDFFAGKNITRPDGMSEVAFNTLISKLKETKAKLEARGEKLAVDRVVVFHKYEDGTRVAGELDALGYNPTTGTFSIYDFKTSKRSFHIAGNKVDTYRTVWHKDQNKSDMEQHTLQLSAYKNLFDSSYESAISGIAIMPFVINYTTKSLTSLTAERGIPLTYNPNTPVKTVKPVEPLAPPVTDHTKEVLDPKPIEGDKGTTSYFELNGEVVTAPTQLIGTIGGYEVRMFKEPVQTRGLGQDLTTLYNYYAIFPNGYAFKFEGMSLQNLEDDKAKSMILTALQGNPARVKQLSELATKVGEYNKPDKKSKFQDAARLLDSTNKKVGETNDVEVGETPPVVTPPKEVKSSIDNSPSLVWNQTWDKLGDDMQQLLEISGYDAEAWDKISPEERKSALDCLGV